MMHEQIEELASASARMATALGTAMAASQYPIPAFPWRNYERT